MGKVEIEIDGKIARIYLNRPKVLNAIDTELPYLLSCAVKEVGDNDEVHVIILSGRGDAFCAGYDLTAFAEDLDIERNTVTYQLSNDAEGRFQIHPMTGEVTVKNGRLKLPKEHGLGVKLKHTKNKDLQ